MSTTPYYAGIPVYATLRTGLTDYAHHIVFVKHSLRRILSWRPSVFEGILIFFKCANWPIQGQCAWLLIEVPVCVFTTGMTVNCISLAISIAVSPD